MHGVVLLPLLKDTVESQLPKMAVSVVESIAGAMCVNRTRASKAIAIGESIPARDRKSVV